MSKLKNGINLKELDKFGYKLGIDDSCHQAYIKDLGNLDYIAIYEDRRILIDIEDFCGNDLKKYKDHLLMDLKKANMLEEAEN